MSIARKLSEKLKRTWKVLGPGLITGASDDDPSGIATYSQAGAQFGFKLLWTAIATYPLMVAIQEMCARIGIVTNRGLTGTIRKYYPKYFLYLVLLVSFPSIVLNIGADIASMGAVGNLLVPSVPGYAWSLGFTIVLLYSTIQWSYRRIATVLKWLCIVLFGYLVIPFITDTNWKDVLKSTLLPSFENSLEYFMALVGILGTTISPYLFFWQTNMEVEENFQRRLVVDKRSFTEEHFTVDKHYIRDMQADVKGGLVLTNIVFYFIILTAGSVLFKAGIHNIQTVEEAAEALKPLAGDMAYVLFAAGVIGTGLLAIPVLAGSLSYMMAETFGWEEGLDKKFHEAKGFYITMIVSVIVGLSIQFMGISPIQALLYTAVLYGITAPVLIAVILHICNNKRIMGRYVNRKWSNIWGGLALLIMTISAGVLIYLFVK